MDYSLLFIDQKFETQLVEKLKNQKLKLDGTLPGGLAIFQQFYQQQNQNYNNLIQKLPQTVSQVKQQRYQQILERIKQSQKIEKNENLITENINLTEIIPSKKKTQNPILNSILQASRKKTFDQFQSETISEKSNISKKKSLQINDEKNQQVSEISFSFGNNKSGIGQQFERQSFLPKSVISVVDEIEQPVQQTSKKILDKYIFHDVPEEPSDTLYREFVDNVSHPYQMMDKNELSEISDDEEFDDAKQTNTLQADDEFFIKKKYQELVLQFTSHQLNEYVPDEFFQQAELSLTNQQKQDLQNQAADFLQQQNNQRKYLNKNLMTKNNKKIIPRWASDDQNLKNIYQQQLKNMNPQQIFGRIDPRNLQVHLKDVFQNKTIQDDRILNKSRGSSAQPWNDDSEFKTPKMEINQFRI